MKKISLVVLLILFLCSIPFIGMCIVTAADNKRSRDFIYSPRYDYMSKEAKVIAERYCGGKDAWKQMEFNKDNEHINIICNDRTQIDIRILSNLPIKREVDNQLKK